MIRSVLLDTGPLLALIDQRDRQHAWAQSQFAEIQPPLLTCEAVLTEACYLARRTHGGGAAVLDLVDRNVVTLSFSLKEHFEEVAALTHRYANVPMSLADACLVRMSELLPSCVVMTLDSGFSIYRRHGRQKLPLLMPPDA